jgi:hypothetical protein
MAIEDEVARIRRAPPQQVTHSIPRDKIEMVDMLARRYKLSRSAVLLVAIARPQQDVEEELARLKEEEARKVD